MFVNYCTCDKWSDKLSKYILILLVLEQIRDLFSANTMASVAPVVIAATAKQTATVSQNSSRVIDLPGLKL